MKKIFVCSIAALAVALSGCTYDDSQVKSDLDELKARVTTLEETTASLGAQLEAGRLIKSITPLEDNSGWTVEFTGGARADSSIEILHGEDGNHGVTPLTEVRRNPDGTTTLWHNVTAGYPASGWVDTEVHLPGVGGLLLSIVDNQAEGTVTLTMNDRNNPHEAFVFEKASTAVRLEIMATEKVGISTGETGKIVFRVNPSNAWVPTGSGEQIAQWALDQTGVKSPTRVSYVTEPDNFTLLSILPDEDGEGHAKTGQYVATIECTEAAGFSDAFQMALVLNTTDDTDPVRVSSPVFALGAYAPFVENSEFFGTWVLDDYYQQTVILTADRLMVVDTDGDGYILEELTWEPVMNLSGAYTSDYPVGYKISGRLAAYSYYTLYMADGSDQYADIGDIAADWYYIDSEGTSLKWGLWEPSSNHEADDGMFYKVGKTDNVPVIGAYYYDDGAFSIAYHSEKTCLGVVCHLDAEDPGHGRMVSVDHGVAVWNEQAENYDATDEEDGLENMAAIADFIADHPGWPSFGAYEWVHAMNPAETTYESGQAGVWYLPAIYEVNFGEIIGLLMKEKIEAAGGTSFGEDYWSSTEYSSEMAWYLDMESREGETANKDDEMCVRALRIF